MMSNSSGYLPIPRGFATAAIHHSQNPEQWDSLAVIPPMVTSAVFVRSKSKSKGYVYGRCGNPSRDVLENILAKLDNGKYALTFSSGMAAVSAILSLIKRDDHIVSALNIYDGTNTIFRKESERVGFEISFIDFSDRSNFEKVIKSNTKIAYIETPSNPTMKVTDISGVAAITKKHNILLIADNTFLTPYFQRPLDLGVDITLYSLTKYMNGHSDVIMGALTMSEENLYTKLKSAQVDMGAVPSPFDCYQVNRSLKTLAIRMQQHSKNALTLAHYLENHPQVDKVLHPGLPCHSGHEVFKKQTSGHSGIFSIHLKGDFKDCKHLIENLNLFAFTGSLGSTESLAHIPALLWQNRMPMQDNLIRFSVGLEDPEDLIADFEQALLKTNLKL